MYNIQQAVIHQLNEYKLSDFPSTKTIKEYAGELKDSAKLTQQLPAIYVMPMESFPLANIPEHQIDILIVTKAQAYGKDENKNLNMQLSQNIVDMFGINPHWVYNDVDFVIDPERFTAKLAMLDNVFAIVVLRMYVKQGID